MTWWQPPLRLDSWKPVQSWFRYSLEKYGDLESFEMQNCTDTSDSFELAFQCHRFEVDQHPVDEVIPVLLKSGQSVSQEEAFEEIKDCRSITQHWCRSTVMPEQLHRRVRCLAMDGDLPTVRLSPSFSKRYSFELSFQCRRFEVNQHPVAEVKPIFLKSGQSASREEVVEKRNERKEEVLQSPPGTPFDSGYVGAFDPCSATWDVLPMKPWACPAFCRQIDFRSKNVLLMEHNGNIFVTENKSSVFKPNLELMVWEEKSEVSGLTIFTRYPDSFSGSKRGTKYPSTNELHSQYYSLVDEKSSCPLTSTSLSKRVAWVDPPHNNFTF
ncbi:hypothetical protein F2Q69_00052510 [Brassica cretica]|uniref:Uncharacterized protein n=1 Tax=Brassica cretica TaxID=69181 RepID=A0A8S9N3Y8_BRACR|nr:hypothetical protein F2Q69_00052510 [Brassica cretica]